VAISGTIPAISHVAVTVTDLSASEAWYTRVFGVGPVLDEDTGPFRHIVYQLGNTMFGLHGFPDLHSKDDLTSRRRADAVVPQACLRAVSSRYSHSITVPPEPRPNRRASSASAASSAAVRCGSSAMAR
jgi:catechol 2,3-dioxygenase-like lactoylglutathione lyase family enzyme